MDYLRNGGNIPENLPQPKTVYSEQLKVLKDLFKMNDEPSKPHTSGVNSSKKFKDSSPKKEKTSKFPEKKEKTTIYQSVKGLSTSIASSSGNGFIRKWENNAPYYIFYTTIPKSPATMSQKNAITFTGEYFMKNLSQYN